MDPRRFDEVARRLADSLSRRAVVGGSLWTAFLAALPSGESVLGKNRRQLRQRRQNDRDREQRQREHNRNRRDNDNNRNQRDKNDGGKHNRGGNGKDAGKDDRGNDKHRDRNQNRTRNRKDNDTPNSTKTVQGEACLNNGKRCGKDKKLKPCSRCCSGFNITTRSKKKKCACRPDGRGCQDNAQCCARVCFQGTCGALS